MNFSFKFKIESFLTLMETDNNWYKNGPVLSIILILQIT